MSLGKIDYPVNKIGDDRLTLNVQIKGFSDFICTCETPMTIAIQGNWGSGKTSFVNMVVDEIKKGEKPDNYVFIPFNSWQFTQFNMSDQLLTSLVSSLTQALYNDLPEQKKAGKEAGKFILNTMKTITMFSLHAANEIVKNKTGFDVAENAGKSISKNEDNTTSDLNELKNNFQTLINERLGIKDEESNPSGKRVIFFVDDLDRLSPEKAVEVLEVLKLFLDCENCIFLLAIDYAVVKNGVSIKYKNTLSSSKGKDFFEKMIQVVYSLPDTLTHTERYIISMLKDNNIKTNISVASDFADLIKSAGKDNPRSIKRLLNSYLLLETMRNHAENIIITEDSIVSLFAVLCLQDICPEAYSYFLRKITDITPKFLDDLKAFCMNQCDETDESIELPDNSIHELGLYTHDNKIDRTKIKFLNTFLSKIYECYIFELGRGFQPGDYFEKKHIEFLTDALNLTVVTRFQNVTYSEYDSVALIYDHRLECIDETKTGTLDEAYIDTIKLIINWLDVNEFTSAINKHNFISLQEFTTMECEKADSKHGVFYICTGYSPSDKVLFCQTLAREFNTNFTWFSNKCGTKILAQGYEEFCYEDCDEA